MSQSSQIPSSDHVTIEQIEFHFDGFVFDAARDELFERATESYHKLEPQVSQLLRLMVTRQGEVLSKEFIQQQLWPNTVVEQNSLYQLLTKTRKLLKDSSRSPNYIKTLPKKGYCFIASVEQPAPPHSSSTSSAIEEHQASGRGKWSRLWLLPLILLSALIGVNFVNSIDSGSIPSYQLQDVTYELGLEFDVSVHSSQDLMAYIKDINNLHITNKQGKLLYQLPSDYRLAFPAWHPEQQRLAYWRYRDDRCELFVINAQGEQLAKGPAMTCEAASKLIWKNATELIVTIKQQGQFVPYLYRLGSETLGNETMDRIELKLPAQGQYKGAVKAWEDQIHYLIVHNDHTSSLIDAAGTSVMAWPFPVWLIAFDAQTQAMVTNDESQRHVLIAKRRNGQQYQVASTAQGLFTSLSIDSQGDIYTAVENWQVNIRDQNNSPIFSTTSIDYLPVSNVSGETAFMSRRSGVCEIYLNSGSKVTKLSHHKGYEYVSFLEWRPDLSLILANRDMDIALYDRQGEVLKFTTEFANRLKNIGWHNTDIIYAFDGVKLHTYDLKGQVLDKTTIAAQAIYFDIHNEQWLVMRNNQLLTYQNLQGEGRLLVSLTPEQTNGLYNVRIKNNTLYWQSSWSKQDKIWRLPLALGASPELVKEGHLIWHFDITPQEQLTIAKMEAIQGDIKRLTTSGFVQ